MLDGATSLDNAVSNESFQLSRFVKDKTLSLVDRIESYEDIIDLDIGDTTLLRARNLERETGLRQLYIKFEGSNPTGTQKDRIAFAQCLDAVRRDYDTIACSTCGNYGAAVALAANLAGLKCYIFIPETFHTLRLGEMEKAGAIIEKVKGTYEDAVRYSAVQASKYGWYDANPGGLNTSQQLMTYAQIAHEIYDTLRDAPKIIAAPVSNGTMFAGIYRGFASLYKRGKTSRIPRMIAASSYKKNPIVYSYQKGYLTCMDLDQTKITENRINEPLINWHSFDGDEALYALKNSNGSAYDISDETMMMYTKKLKIKEGLHVLPASTVGLAALLDLHQKTPLEPDRYVAVLTGRK
ncbi:MAG: pyridoxal-phosphate dependent enzyme [Deltaproteobacteria bacterium]|nr:pyridoxal-phosphate dependent enzyme [Deltaproteobacteria bacterium]